MSDGIQHKIGRNRPPKVHITFDSHVDGATKKVELPFLVGVMADLSNRDIVDASGEKVPVKNRKFKEIDRDIREKACSFPTRNRRFRQLGRA